MTQDELNKIKLAFKNVYQTGDGKKVLDYIMGFCGAGNSPFGADASPTSAFYKAGIHCVGVLIKKHLTNKK